MLLFHSSASPQAPFPPFVDGFPLLGNVASLARDPVRFFVDSYQRYGPAYRLRILGREQVVLAGPEANRFVQREGHVHLRSREIWGEYNKEYGAHASVMSLDGPPHFELRRTLQRGYSARMAEGREREIVALAQTPFLQAESAGSVAVVPTLKKMVVSQLGALLTNHDMSDAGSEPYVDDLGTFLRTALNVTVLHRWPRLMLAHPAYRRSKSRILALGRIILEEHKGASHAVPDLVDDLLEVAQKNPSRFENADLAMFCLGPFVAGVDTSANTAAFLLHALLRHPEVFRQVVDEVDACMPQSDFCDLKGLMGMKTLRGALLETLRLRPVAPATMRYAEKSFSFAGHTIPGGAPVLVAQTVPHFLPDVWEDPKRFDPSRHRNADSIRGRDRFAPYGLGPHTCLGSRLAELQIMLSVASILRVVELELENPQQKLRVRSSPTLAPDRRFRVRVRRR